MLTINEVALIVCTIILISIICSVAYILKSNAT